MPKIRPAQSVKRKHKKTKKVKIVNKKNSTSSSDESCYQTARSTQPRNQNENPKDVVSYKQDISIQ